MGLEYFFLKDEAYLENLTFFGSMFQSVGAKKEKDRSPYDFVLTEAGMHSIRLAEELPRGHVDLEQIK